jgi:hypothetical protein
MLTIIRQLKPGDSVRGRTVSVALSASTYSPVVSAAQPSPVIVRDIHLATTRTHPL